eukprot:12511699-Alexandrium_andersonii.AAC.1
MAHRCVAHLCSWRKPTGGTLHPTDGCTGARGESRAQQSGALVPVANAAPNRRLHKCRGASRTQRP